jgi:hypothetical protein
MMSADWQGHTTNQLTCQVIVCDIIDAKSVAISGHGFMTLVLSFEFIEFVLFLQGQCTLINVSVKVPVLASRLSFNRSYWAGYWN